jgi:hypothetical protein
VKPLIFNPLPRDAFAAAQTVGARLYPQNKVPEMLFVLAEYTTADLPGIDAG